MAYGTSSFSSTGPQPVAITSVDTTNRQAKALTRRGTEVTVDLSYHAGGVQVTPAVGEQWLVTMDVGPYYRLSSKLPTNAPEMTTQPVQGQVQVGSSGPLELNGSKVNVNADVLAIGDSQVRSNDGALEHNVGTDDDPDWQPVTPTSSDGVPEGDDHLYYTDERAAAAAPVQSVGGKTGNVVLDQSDVGLGNVDNTSDLDKPLSDAVTDALGNKADSSTVNTLSDVVDDVVDTQIPTLDAGLTSVQTGHQQLVEAVVTGATGTPNAAATETDATSAVDGLRQSTVDIGSQVSTLTAQSKGAAAGSDFGGNPSNPDPSGWGTNWTVTGGGTVQIDTHYHYSWTTSGTAARKAVGIWNDVTQTDFQSVRLVLFALMEAPPTGSPSSICGNSLIVRADSATNPQNYVEARLYGDKVELINVDAGVPTVLATAALFPSIGATYELDAGTEDDDYEYVFRVSGNKVLSYTDSAHATKMGSAYRHVGMAMYSDARTTRESLPGQVAYWKGMDNSPHGTLGSGFMLSRHDTTTMVQPQGANSVGAQFYDTVNYMTSDYSRSFSQVTVRDAGWYQFTLSMPFLNSSGQWGYVSGGLIGCFLFKNSSIAAQGPMRNVAASDTSCIGVFGTFTIYCEAGDVISPGLVFGPGGVNLSGEATGTMCTFSGAKLNP